MRARNSNWITNWNNSKGVTLLFHLTDYGVFFKTKKIMLRRWRGNRTEATADIGCPVFENPYPPCFRRLLPPKYQIQMMFYKVCLWAEWDALEDDDILKKKKKKKKLYRGSRGLDYILKF